MKKKLIIAAILGFGFFVLYWLFTHSFIEVVIANQGKEPANYTISDQNGTFSAEFSDTSNTVRKLVRKGTHEVLVKQGDTSYFTVIDSGSFLSTKTVTATLQKEKAREFVGDNPGPCINYTAGVMISYSCTGHYTDVQLHVPANETLPTIVKKVSAATGGLIEGIVSTKQGTLAIIRLVVGDEGGPPHSVYTVGADGKLQSGEALTDLDSNKRYLIKSHRDGFLAYDSAFTEAFYYENKTSEPERIELPDAKDQSLEPYAMSVQNETFAVAYSISETNEELDQDDAHSANTKSEVVVKSGSNVKYFNFKTRYAYIILCGQQKLCLGLNDRVEIYDISGDKQEYLYGVSNFKRLERLGNNVLVIRSDQVLLLDPEKRTGYIQYSLGYYTYCGMHLGVGDYTLCLVSAENKKVAIRVDTSSENSDSIDKKVSELAALQEVRTVSAYKRFIYISPELGEMEYIESEGGFGYNPARRSSVNKIIDDAINRIDFDKNKYRIVNVLR